MPDGRLCVTPLEDFSRSDVPHNKTIRRKHSRGGFPRPRCWRGRKPRMRPCDVAIAHDMSVSPGRTAESAEAIDWPHRARAHPLAVADAVKALTRAFLQWQIRACALISPMAAAPRLRSHQPSLPTQGSTAGMRVLGQAVSGRCFRFWNAVSSGEAQGNCH
jgi:hypothetical protein